MNEQNLSCPNCGNRQVKVLGVVATEFDQQVTNGALSGEPNQSDEAKRYIDAVECSECGYRHWVEPDWAADLRLRNAELTVQIAKLLGFEPANQLPC